MKEQDIKIWGSEYGPGIKRNAAGQKDEKKKGLSKALIFFIIFVFSLFSLTAGFLGGLLAFSNSNNLSLQNTFNNLLPDRATSSFSKSGLNLEHATGSEMTIQEIVNKNALAVVEIRTEQVATDIWLGQYITQGAGSGVIIKDDGYIVTNNHVIEGARKITVTLKTGTSYSADLIATDPQTDVALLKINAQGLSTAVSGDSSALVVGDLAVAIGNPLGELGGTATAGIISALDRSVTVSGKHMLLLQTDASINPGNSGGGLFNQYGELIGIVVAKSGGSNVEGLGFAIPINSVEPVLEDLMKVGYVQGRVQMGLTLVDITTKEDALRYGVPALGVYVVSADTAQSKAAGFVSGDRILFIEGAVINSYDDVPLILSKLKIGEEITVTIARDGKIEKLNLTLQEKRN